MVHYRPDNFNLYRTQLTVGGNDIKYPGDCGTPTMGMLTVKFLLNSSVSTPGANFVTIDIKDFYLNMPMDRFEYIWMKLGDLPEDFIKQYNMTSKVTKDGYVYIKFRKKCMDCRKQASWPSSCSKRG